MSGASYPFRPLPFDRVHDELVQLGPEIVALDPQPGLILVLSAHVLTYANRAEQLGGVPVVVEGVDAG